MAVFISPAGIECTSAEPNFSYSGMPFNMRKTGTVTTDAQGGVYVGVNSWTWSYFPSFKRVQFTLISFWNDNNNQVASCFMYNGSGNRVINIAQDAFQGSAAWSAYCGFTSNSGAGQRFYYLLGASANASYNYEFRAVTPSPDLDGYGSF